MISHKAEYDTIDVGRRDLSSKKKFHDARRIGRATLVSTHLLRPRAIEVWGRVEAGDPGETFHRLVASEEPFAELFNEKLAELHGYDLRRRRGSSTELIFEHPGYFGGL